MWLLRLVPVVACAACLSDVALVQPDLEGPGGGEPGVPGTPGGGTVQRATLVITVTVTGADSTRAARLGMPAGRLSQAQVTVTRDGSAGRWADTADANGVAQIPQLLPGSYRVSVARLLSPAEQALLEAADQDVNAFGGGGVVGLAAPQSTVSVGATAGRRGSLVISEVYDRRPIIAGGSYNFAGYVEVYNNADTTIYLDGKIVASGMLHVTDQSTAAVPYTCDDSAIWRLDPNGIWTSYITQFPGTGQQYPLGPGEAAVLATDALDHSIVSPDLPNLAGARFEFLGSADTDNPTAANMRFVAGVDFYELQGRGFLVGATGRETLFLANPVDLAGLPQGTVPFGAPGGPVHYRIPGAAILDVFAATMTPDRAAALGAVFCPQVVAQEHDRQHAQFLGVDRGGSMARSVFGALPNGRALLQRTRTTANDFLHRGSVGTPGFVH